MIQDSRLVRPFDALMVAPRPWHGARRPATSAFFLASLFSIAGGDVGERSSCLPLPLKASANKELSCKEEVASEASCHIRHHGPVFTLLDWRACSADARESREHVVSVCTQSSPRSSEKPVERTKLIST